MINHILLNEEEKKRILNLHKNEISKYRNSKILNEQGAADRYIDNIATQSISNSNTQAAQTETPEIYSDAQQVADLLTSAYEGGGTKVGVALDVFRKIDPNKFDSIIKTLLDTEINGEQGLVAVMNDEYGFGDKGALNDIKNVFKNNGSGYEISWTNSNWTDKVSGIKITGNPNPDKPSDDIQNTEDGSQNTGGSQAATAREQRRQQLTNTTNTIRQKLGLQSGGGVDQEFINKAYAEIYYNR